MGQLVRASEDRMEYRSGGRGLALSSVAVGGGIIALILSVAGSGLTLWSWILLVIATLQLCGGVILLRRGPAIWAFDRTGGRVSPPRRSAVMGFPIAEIDGVVMERPRPFAPTLLLLSRGDDGSCTLEVGGALDRNGFRSRGLELAGFLGVPFIDRTL
jgi:hypothetical protein